MALRLLKKVGGLSIVKFVSVQASMIRCAQDIRAKWVVYVSWETSKIATTEFFNRQAPLQRHFDDGTVTPDRIGAT
jgi:hypothetical protein